MPIVLASALDNFDDRSNEFGLRCEDPSLTQQSFAAEADINTIVDRFMKTGVLPEPARLPQYVDLSTGVFDYQAAQNLIRQADNAFMTLSARVRARFNNSPHEFLVFFQDPANREEGERLGLLIPAKPDVGGIGGSAPDVEPDAG